MKRLLPLVSLSLLVLLAAPLAAQRPVTPSPKAAPGAQNAPQLPKAAKPVPGKRIHPRAGARKTGKGRAPGPAKVKVVRPGQDPAATAKPVSPVTPALPAGKHLAKPGLLRELSERETRYQLRRAKLQRLRELAQQDDDKDMLKEVDQVISDNETAHKQRLEGLRKRFGQEALDEAYRRIKRRSADDVRLKKLGQDPTGQAAAEGGTPDGAGGPKGKKEDMVTICHVSPTNPSKHRTIQVSRAALQAHLSHGDTLGPCPKAAPPQSQPRPRAVRTPRPQQLQPGKVQGKGGQLHKRGPAKKGTAVPKGGGGN